MWDGSLHTPQGTCGQLGMSPAGTVREHETHGRLLPHWRPLHASVDSWFELWWRTHPFLSWFSFHLVFGFYWLGSQRVAPFYRQHQVTQSLERRHFQFDPLSLSLTEGDEDELEEDVER